MLYRFRQLCRKSLARLIASVMFYTCVPLPASWPVEFDGMTLYAPIVGLLIALVLGALWQGLTAVGLATGLIATIVVAVWLRITGGLHLDGAMDAADGLGVSDPVRRLEVMRDSRSGAFGVMVGIVLLGLKTVAIATLTQGHLWALIAACTWGRWGQLAAIVRHPYLRPQGQGAFHKAYLTSPWQIVPLLIVVFGLNFLPLYLGQVTVAWAVGMAVGGGAIALGVGSWFNRQFGGQTGDTYGAIVEWTEALVLVLANLVAAHYQWFG
jgi:adenosylcobinamide-GDP ribazoletransferase